eukprot:EC791988.1.p1 GENE.EC791988.1~~EC791988.1.p1  ORF type:complete len:107 (+),score=13.93 EC791988.1:28-348(+)
MGSSTASSVALTSPAEHSRDGSSRFPIASSQLSEREDSLREAGVEKISLIFAVEFTGSNTTAGVRTFDGLSLHHLFVENETDVRGETRMIPYHEIIRTLGGTVGIA